MANGWWRTIISHGLPVDHREQDCHLRGRQRLYWTRDRCRLTTGPVDDFVFVYHLGRTRRWDIVSGCSEILSSSVLGDMFARCFSIRQIMQHSILLVLYTWRTCLTWTWRQRTLAGFLLTIWGVFAFSRVYFSWGCSRAYSLGWHPFLSPFPFVLHAQPKSSKIYRLAVLTRLLTWCGWGHLKRKHPAFMALTNWTTVVRDASAVSQIAKTIFNCF